MGAVDNLGGLVLLILGGILCAGFSASDRLVGAPNVKGPTAFSWIALMGVIIWRIHFQGWPTSLYWPVASVYLALLFWTGFRPFLIVPKLWAEEKRSNPVLARWARVAQIGYWSSFALILVWALMLIFA